MHDYDDSPLFPDAVQLIDDTDNPNATNFATMIEALADRTRFLHMFARQPQIDLFTANDTFMPTYTGPVVLIGCGGGGGGAGGVTCTVSLNIAQTVGGGGGGGALLGIQFASVVDGVGCPITIGSAGTGGAVDTDGTDGGNTIFQTDFTTDYQFWGAQRGFAGVILTTPGLYAWALGGRASKFDTVLAESGAYASDEAGMFVIKSPGQGGNGTIANGVYLGNTTAQGGYGHLFSSNSKGLSGDPGGSGVSFTGGGPGGAGGGGAFHRGGNGGDGGHANDSGVGNTGFAGSAGPSGGAGGGGGGGGGGGSSTGAPGGVGGNGAKGLLYVISWPPVGT